MAATNIALCLSFFLYRAIIIPYTFSIWFPFVLYGENGDCGSCQPSFFSPPPFVSVFLFNPRHSRMKCVSMCVCESMCVCLERKKNDNTVMPLCLYPPSVISTTEKKKKKLRKLWLINSAENKSYFSLLDFTAFLSPSADPCRFAFAI